MPFGFAAALTSGLCYRFRPKAVFGKNSMEVRARGRERKYAVRVVVGEVAEDLFNHGLCLPSGTAIKEDDLDRVIDVVRKCH